jgi:hypothetical protein
MKVKKMKGVLFMCFFKKRKERQRVIEQEKAQLAKEEANKAVIVEENKEELKPEIQAEAVVEPKEVESAPVVQAVKPAKEVQKEKTPKIPRYHVSQNKDENTENFKKWRVRKEGSEKTIKFFDTQKEAINYASGLAEGAGSNVVIHKVDGSIRKQDYIKKN